ncbi:MAG: WD40 repeat domain-containing protein [Candidatus Hodarchaeota archaeon]
MPRYNLEINPNTIQLLNILPFCPRNLTELALDEERLYLAFDNRKVMIFALDSFEQVGEVQGMNIKSGCSQDAIFGQIPAVLVDDLYIHVMGDGSYIHSFDKQELQEHARVPISPGSWRSFSMDGDRFLAGDFDPDVDKYVVNVYYREEREKHELDYRPDFYESWYTFKKVASLQGHTEVAHIICHDDERIYSWSRNEMIIWDKKSHQQVDIIENNHLQSKMAALNDDYLFTVPWESGNIIKVWDKQHVELVAELKGHQNPIWNLIIDGSHLISQSTLDGRIRGWNLKDDFKEIKIRMEESNLHLKVKELISRFHEESTS